ncbi:GNAT family N-acetyltransferase [Oceanirhabdus seepicola]|uniref:GNAT family N-acetyltransferase n=1 Tax=Oceanirhabdus seepicola TaxID=2828781 RepID=A0A9J6P5L8_9CLOT|nr:GNAT family N-acetyltransferase [Oceanirhabdus seepicola]
MARIKEEIINIDGQDILITTPTKEDAKEVLEFRKCAYEESDFLLRYPDELNITEEQQGNFLDKMIESQLNVFICLKVGNKIIANSNVNGNDKRKCRHIGSIGISIRKDYWGKGLGTKLFEKILEWADEMNISRLTLEVDATNERGIALYKKFGFEIEGTHKMTTRLSDGTFRDSYSMARIAE